MVTFILKTRVKNPTFLKTGLPDPNPTFFYSTTSLLPGPELPCSICQHSMIEVDSRTVYIIGGLQNGSLSSPSNKIWTIDIMSDNFSNEWIEGPSLNEPRYRHACGKMTMKGKTILVVAGGRNKDSVELLDTSLLDIEQKWVKG